MYWSFITINPSQWLILGGIFAVLCLFMPKRIPMTISGAALITAAALFIYTVYKGQAPSILFQILTFLGLLVMGLFFVRPPSWGETAPFPHPHAVFTLDMPIEKGRGTYTHDGKTYKLVGPDAPMGAQVSIISIRGQTLYIEVLSR